VVTHPVEIRERRGAHRIQVNLPARYRSDDTTLVGWVANVSRNGMFLRSQYVDEHGAAVEVSFALPGDRQPVALTGTVVRVHESPLCPGMAIRFVGMAEVARRRLAEFMSRRSRTLANR
jgi:uncharacterized protein (TIGR02266 family)